MRLVVERVFYGLVLVGVGLGGRIASEAAFHRFTMGDVEVQLLAGASGVAVALGLVLELLDHRAGARRGNAGTAGVVIPLRGRRAR